MPLRALHIAPFRRLVTSYTINEFGDSIAVVALAILVYGKTHDPLALTALFIANKFAAAFLAPALTARMDRARTERVLPAIYTVEAVAFIGLVLLAHHFSLVPVLALSLIDGTLALTGRGLNRAAVAAVLKPADALRDGNAIMNIGFAVSAAAGPAVAGVVVVAFGTGTALVIDAASFLVIAVILGTAPAFPLAQAASDSLLTRVRAGLGYAGRHQWVRVLLFAEGAALVFFTFVVPIEVVYVRSSLHSGNLGLGLLLSAWGAGIVVGSAVFAHRREQPLRLLILLSTIAIGGADIGLAAAGSLAIACVISVIGGIGNGIQWIAVVTAIQEATEPAYQARIVGLLESISAAAPAAGFLLGGVITAALSPRIAYLAAGCGVMLVVVFVLVAARAAEQPQIGALGDGIGEPAREAIAEQGPSA